MKSWEPSWLRVFRNSTFDKARMSLSISWSATATCKRELTRSLAVVSVSSRNSLSSVFRASTAWTASVALASLGSERRMAAFALHLLVVLLGVNEICQKFRSLLTGWLQRPQPRFVATFTDLPRRHVQIITMSWATLESPIAVKMLGSSSLSGILSSVSREKRRPPAIALRHVS